MPMKIAVAQIRPFRGNMAKNILVHKKAIDLAVVHQVDGLFFPELSLTGYEPALARELAKDPNDPLFDQFQEISDAHGLTLGIGAPTKADSGIRVSMLVFQPSRPKQVYSKQQLHADELPYFVSGKEQMMLTVNNEKVAPAICYESLQTSHVDTAAGLGAEVYIASVAKSQNGVDKAIKHYPAIARKHAMPVLMSNCLGFCDNFLSVGRSAVWTKHGRLAGQLDDKNEGILVFDTETEKVVEVML